MTRDQALHELLDCMTSLRPKEIRSLAMSLPSNPTEAITDLAYTIQLPPALTVSLISNKINIATELENYARWKGNQ